MFGPIGVGGVVVGSLGLDGGPEPGVDGVEEGGEGVVGVVGMVGSPEVGEGLVGGLMMGLTEGGGA